MKPLHRITIIAITETEKTAFRQAGVEFMEITRGPRGEAAIFEMGEEDPRWGPVAALLQSLEASAHVPKKYRVQDLRVTKSAAGGVADRSPETLPSRGVRWLHGYSGQSTDELLALEGTYRIDSLVLVFEEAIGQKAARNGGGHLTAEERTVLAIEALEREVNNGGYDQFFKNSSRQFTPFIVESLRRIGCKQVATITQEAIKALGISDLRADAIEAALTSANEQVRTKLNRCDERYYENSEPITERLFTFIKANKTRILPKLKAQSIT